MPVIPTTLSIRTYHMVRDYFKDKGLDQSRLMCFFTMVDLRKNMHHETMEELYKDKRLFANYIPYQSDIEKMGSREFVSINGSPTLIIRLEKVMDVSPCPENEELLLLLPKNIPQKFGILISEVLDTVESDLYLNQENYREDGLMGTAMLRGHITLFPDIGRIIELAEPKWRVSEQKQD